MPESTASHHRLLQPKKINKAAIAGGRMRPVTRKTHPKVWVAAYPIKPTAARPEDRGRSTRYEPPFAVWASCSWTKHAPGAGTSTSHPRQGWDRPPRPAGLEAPSFFGVRACHACDCRVRPAGRRCPRLSRPGGSGSPEGLPGSRPAAGRGVISRPVFAEVPPRVE